jgi:hypothetical protein
LAKLAVKKLSVALVLAVKMNQLTPNALQYYQYLLSKGESPQVAAAMLGNAGQESQYNPKAIGDGGGSGGLFQFNKGGEAPAFQSWAAQNKREVNDPYAQMDFVRAQLQSPAYAKVYNQMQNAPNLEGATSAFMSGYERPNKDLANLSSRIDYAKQFLNPLIKDAGTPTSDSVPQPYNNGMQQTGLLGDPMKMAMGLLQSAQTPAPQIQMLQPVMRRPQPFTGFNFLG